MREYGALNWAAAEARTAGGAMGAAEYDHDDWAQDVMSITARSSGQRLGGDDHDEDCNFRRAADAVAATKAAGMAAVRRHGHGDDDVSRLDTATAPPPGSPGRSARGWATAECGEACPCGACATLPSFVVGGTHAATSSTSVCSAPKWTDSAATAKAPDTSEQLEDAEDDVALERMDEDPSMAQAAPVERLTEVSELPVMARAENAAAVAEEDHAAIAAHAEAAAAEAAEAAKARAASAATATAALAVVTAVAEDDPEVAAIQAAAAATQHRAEQAIQQLVATAAMTDVASSLRTVLRILENVRMHPHESRYRRLRWTNAALRARVQRFPPAAALLRAAGFTVRAQLA
jgi:chemotaxis protein histidine kinase CheA